MPPYGNTLLQEIQMNIGEQALARQPLTAEACNWYAVYTRSRHEKVVHHALGETGMQSFLPLRNVLSQWKDRRKQVQKPLFPGYLFVRVPQLHLHHVVRYKSDPAWPGPIWGKVPARVYSDQQLDDMLTKLKQAQLIEN